MNLKTGRALRKPVLRRCGYLAPLKGFWELEDAGRSGWMPERRSGWPGSLWRGRACTAAGYWPLLGATVPLAAGRHVSVLDRRR